jgi:hypothetical protein
VHTNVLQPEVGFTITNLLCPPDIFLQWLINYFSHLTTEQSMGCMQEMLHVNIRQNLQVVIQIATKYSDGQVKLIEMFESFKTFEGNDSIACPHGIH